MPVEPLVTFLNVDLELYGAFDRKALIKALGKSVAVLHEGEPEGTPLVFEVANSMGLDVAGRISRFLDLVERLSKKARTAWESAEHRRFDIGFGAGKKPFSTCWTLPSELVARLAAVGAELCITVYGAEAGGSASKKTARRPR